MLQKSATKTVTLTTEGGALTITPTSATVTYDTEIVQDLNIPPNQTLKGYTVAIPISNLQMFAMAIFQAPGDTGQVGPVTVQFDLGPSPSSFSYILTEANGVCWVNGDVDQSSPLTATVSTIWITNSYTANMVLQIRAGLVATNNQ